MLSPEQLFANNDITARLLPHVRLLGRLNQALREEIPPALACGAQVANFRQQTVIVHASNAAIATKLRQLGERLCDAFAKIVGECKRVEIKVQPIPDPVDFSSSRLFPDAGEDLLSPAGREKLLALASAMPEDSPLAAALKRIAGRSQP
ncbi:MAG: DUF721 domain-containing protein [Zoogloeaceae bacterium]|jgi:hypothetical protein|nr:DUF721 domain-containing protein [Zoogloeaceae bacterium]